MYVLFIGITASSSDILRSSLRQVGIRPAHTASPDDADLIVRTAHFSAAVLDLRSTGEAGMALLERWERDQPGVPVVAIAPGLAAQQRVASLRAGADDCLSDGYEPSELVARLQALQRRTIGRNPERLVHGALCYEMTRCEVTLDGKAVRLSRRELSLLRALLQNSRRVLSMDQIKDLVYGRQDCVNSNAVNVHIHHLRRKLGVNIVETVPGFGYRLGVAGG
jgi:two-component system response regulator QseB